MNNSGWIFKSPLFKTSLLKCLNESVKPCSKIIIFRPFYLCSQAKVNCFLCSSRDQTNPIDTDQCWHSISDWVTVRYRWSVGWRTSWCPSVFPSGCHRGRLHLLSAIETVYWWWDAGYNLLNQWSQCFQWLLRLLSAKWFVRPDCRRACSLALRAWVALALVAAVCHSRARSHFWPVVWRSWLISVALVWYLSF